MLVAPTPPNPMDLTATDLARCIQSGQITPLASIEACLQRIAQRDTSINAFTLVCSAAALQRARAQTSALARGEIIGPLAGVPLAVKDLEDVKGLPTSHGCKAFTGAHAKPAEASSVQVARLEAAGAIVVGKTNTPIFGSAAYCKNLAFGSTKNPWKVERTPGGSSGGSAAAVAARMVPLATAADSGGSIRIPAAFTGTFGLKPSFGRIPDGEGSAFGFQKWMRTTHQGPICRSVADAALYLDIVAGHHPSDYNSLPRPMTSFVAAVERPLTLRLRVGFTHSLGYVTRVKHEIVSLCHRALGVLRGAGHDIVELADSDASLPDLGLQWGLAMGAQSYAMLSGPLQGHEHDVERGFLSSFAMTQQLSMADLGELHRQIFLLNSRLQELFTRFDVFATPAMPVEPFNCDGPMPRHIDGEEMESPMHTVGFMYPFNFSGHPAAVVRAGLTDDGLPCALQLVAPPHRDDLLLQLSRQYESRSQCFDTWPAVELTGPTERSML